MHKGAKDHSPGDGIATAEGRHAESAACNAFARGSVVLRSPGAADLLAVRAWDHAGCTGRAGFSAARADLSGGTLASASQPRRPGRVRALPCRLARFADFSLPRLPSGNRRPAEAETRHASGIYMAEPKASCVRCHSEHNGANFSLLHWDPSPAKFDHAKTGFALDGKHAGLTCNKCHNAANVGQLDRTALQVKDPNRTYLGLSRNCVTCHEDKHKGQLGANCLQCHNNQDWKEARSFDHSKTKFALTGLHRQVTCQKCHAASRRRCAEVCRAQVRSLCGVPQRSASRRIQARLRILPQHFHLEAKLVRRPVRPLQDEVPACWASTSMCVATPAIAVEISRPRSRTMPAPTATSPIRMVGNSWRAQTEAAANPATRWTASSRRNIPWPTTRATAFPLRAKHAEVACAKCHVPAGRATVFKIKASGCVDCHQDVHRNQFAARSLLQPLRAVPQRNHVPLCGIRLGASSADPLRAYRQSRRSRLHRLPQAAESGR